MQTRVIVAVVLAVVLMAATIGHAMAAKENITVRHAGGDGINLGRSVKLSGTNLAMTDAYPITYIALEKVGGGLIRNYQVQSDNHMFWTYEINSLDLGTYRVTVRRSPDSTEFAQDEFRIVVPTPIPTPTPTPDYAAQIAALETRVAAQETKIQAQATQIQEIAIRTPVPTTIIPTTVPTTVITTKTPVPTQTPDYEATLAAIQKQIDQQNDIIYQILHFLGLK